MWLLFTFQHEILSNYCDGGISSGTTTGIFPRPSASVRPVITATELRMFNSKLFLASRTFKSYNIGWYTYVFFNIVLISRVKKMLLYSFHSAPFKVMF